MKCWVPLLAMLAFCLGASDGAAAEAVASISGVVADATGAVLPGVTVTLKGGAEGPRSSVTGADGRYEIGDLARGAYVLEASLAGFQAVRQEVSVPGGTLAVADITLRLGGLLESVSVTATKTGHSDVQKTPLAVTALSGHSLEQTATNNIRELAGYAPSLTVSQNSGFAQITIRGIGTNAVFAGSDPSSTVHLDGVYLARPTMAFYDFLDVERVEILRGPQGTLYGRNSVGGTINIISRQPGNELAGSVRVLAGNYSRLRGEASFSGPLARDKVMGSLSVLRHTREGYVANRDHPESALGSEDVVVGRGQLRFMMGQRGQLLLAGDYSHSDIVPLGFSKPIFTKPGFEFTQIEDLQAVRHNEVSYHKQEQAGISARFSYQLSDRLTLNSLTARRTNNYDAQSDTDTTELSLLSTEQHNTQSQVSEELTLVGSGSNLTWVTGVYYFREDDELNTTVHLRATNIDNNPHPFVDTRAWAGFGQATVKIGSRLSATAGLRYTSEAKDLRNSGGLFRAGTRTLAVPTSGFSITDRTTYDAWTPRLGIEFQVARDVMAYASATRGFKSGGYNFTAPEPGRGFRPEFAMSYEAGLKATIAGGRLRLNSAAFSNDYEDLQVQSFIRPGIIDITNAASARIQGFELEVAAAPTRYLQFSGFLTWLDATYDDYIWVAAGGVRRDVAGNRLNNSPEWLGGGAVQGEIPAGSAGSAILRAQVNFQSRVFFTPLNDTIETQKGYALVHLSSAWRTRSGRWEISAYVRNAADRDYITGTGSFPPPAISGRPGDPRTFGAQLAFRY